ncbi:MAG: hypothetical protein LBQ54_06580, partial [Planctomycetaceae bacterium]|nr:hypothetical protein [Planctomycetaceae bacterium]
MSNAGKIFQKEKTEHPAALRRGIRVPHYTAYSITMIINDIEFYLVEIPRQADIGFRSLFVRLLSHNGLEGWGEAAVSWRQDEIEPRRKQILPILSGRSIFDLEELIHLEELQPKALRFAVDMACWDMIGRLFKHPVCHFHGGEYRHHIPIIARLSGNSPEEYVRSAQEFSHLGYHWQTLPLSGNPDSDIKCITALLDTFANRIDLRLDASGKYDYSDCLSFLSHLEKKNIAMLIDPLNEENGFYEASALQEQTEIPIALRRGICSAGNVLEITKRGNIRRLVLDPQEFGS